jgi:hypothetical protein
MTTRTHPVDRRLWFVSLVLIVAIVAVGIIVNRGSPSHVASPVVVRLAAVAIVTACAAVAVAGPRAAARRLWLWSHRDRGLIGGA